MKHHPASLANLAESPDPVARLRALRLMRYQIEAGQMPAEYLPLARRLLLDPDHDCRWQAAMVISRSIGTHSEDVWQIVREFGESPDEDMRDVVATILLPPLLQSGHGDYQAKLRGLITNGSHRLLADTASRSGWPAT